MYKGERHLPLELSQEALAQKKQTITYILLKPIIDGRYKLSSESKLEQELIQNIIEISKFGAERLPSYYEENFITLVKNAIKKLEEDMPQKIDLINALKQLLTSPSFQ